MKITIKNASMVFASAKPKVTLFDQTNKESCLYYKNGYYLQYKSAGNLQALTESEGAECLVDIPVTPNSKIYLTLDTSDASAKGSNCFFALLDTNKKIVHFDADDTIGWNGYVKELASCYSAGGTSEFDVPSDVYYISLTITYNASSSNYVKGLIIEQSEA